MNPTELYFAILRVDNEIWALGDKFNLAHQSGVEGANSIVLKGKNR